MLEGTVKNGVIVLDGGTLPEGVRVRVEIAEDDAMGPPTEPDDREHELAILRESLEDVRAGRVTPAREFLKELAAKHHLPLDAGE